MDTEEINQTTETKHLGIKRNNKNNIDIEDRIKLARRTIYALLGPGLHARRGMSPVVAYKLMSYHAHQLFVIKPHLMCYCC
jgi:hypothetical protein